MVKTATLILGLILMACQNPADSNSYSGGYSGTMTGGSGGSGNQNVPVGPPYTVTYRNTTVNTTGTVPVDAAAYQPGATVSVLGNSGSLSWPPFVFVGWNTQDNGGSLGGGGGTTYVQGGTFTIHSNIVLYGTWQ